MTGMNFNEMDDMLTFGISDRLILVAFHTIVARGRRQVHFLDMKGYIEEASLNLDRPMNACPTAAMMALRSLFGLNEKDTCSELIHHVRNEMDMYKLLAQTFNDGNVEKFCFELNIHSNNARMIDCICGDIVNFFNEVGKGSLN